VDEHNNPPGGVVLDPFAGSGTTMKVALELGRNAIGIELNLKYAKLIKQRVQGVGVIRVNKRAEY
jgi:modification methylase